VGVVCLDSEVVLLLAEAGAPPCYLISDDDDDKNSDNNHALQLTLLRANGDGAAMAELWERRVVRFELALIFPYLFCFVSPPPPPSRPLSSPSP
jgi:hypothetical protein